MPAASAATAHTAVVLTGTSPSAAASPPRHGRAYAHSSSCPDLRTLAQAQAHAHAVTHTGLEGITTALWGDEHDDAEAGRLPGDADSPLRKSYSVSHLEEVAADSERHRRWRAGMPLPIQWLDKIILAPWWNAHVARHPKACEGNTRDKYWIPRPYMPVYFVMLIVAMLLTPALVNALELHWFAPHHCTLAKCSILLCFMSVAGFAYSNYVTTARKTFFRGKHGGYRDIAIVLAAIPYIMWTAALPYAELLFPVPHGEGDLAASHGIDTGLRIDFSGSSDTLAPWDAVNGRALKDVQVPLALRASFSEGAKRFILQPARSAFLPDHVVARAGANYHALILCGLFVIGLHTAYLVRAGFFQKSISHQDVATSSIGGIIGIIVRLLIIGIFVGDHLWWLAEHGFLMMRLPAYIGIVAGIAYVSHKIKAVYYFHWHHWAAGLMLAPLCHNHSPEVALGFLGFVLSQFVEGAARWSCAPMWHRFPGSSR